MLLRWFLRARFPFTLAVCIAFLMNLNELAELGTAGIVNIIIRVAGVVVILGGEVALRRHLAQEGIKLPSSTVAPWSIFRSRASPSPRGGN